MLQPSEKVAPVGCIAGLRWALGEMGKRLPLIAQLPNSTILLAKPIVNSTYTAGRWQFCGRRLVVSISDSVWSLVVGLLGVVDFWQVWDWHERNAACRRRAAWDTNFDHIDHPFVHERTRGTTKNGNGNTLLSTKGREGPRRTTKNGNGNTLLSTKAREGPRRTAKATPFCPRRAAKGHEGPRRTATATPFCPRRAAKGHEENLIPFDLGRPRRATKGCSGALRIPP